MKKGISLHNRAVWRGSERILGDISLLRSGLELDPQATLFHILLQYSVQYIASNMMTYVDSVFWIMISLVTAKTIAKILLANKHAWQAQQGIKSKKVFSFHYNPGVYSVQDQWMVSVFWKQFIWFRFLPPVAISFQIALVKLCCHTGKRVPGLLCHYNLHNPGRGTF